MNLKCEKYDEYLSSLLIQYNPNPPIILIADHLQIRTASCCDRLILSENLSILLTPWRLIGNRRLFLTSYSERDPLLEGDTYYSAVIYLLKVNNRNTRTKNEICSKLTIKTLGRRQWPMASFWCIYYCFENIFHFWF